jgi:general secretion pathway protein L
MKLAGQITEGVGHWIDSAAEAFFALRRRFATSRTVRLVEGADNAFAIVSGEGAPQQGEPARVRVAEGEPLAALPESLRAQASGSRLELVLQPSRFMFRPLELPRRAAEFLGGIVRAQIDRLTPWSADDAAFGWSEPAEIANDRIAVTVAATARSSISPLIQALGGLGADSIAVSTRAPGEPAAAGVITVYDQQDRAAVEVRRLRRALVGVLLIAIAAAGVAFAADEIIGGNLQARQDEVAHKIAVVQTAMRARIDTGGDSVVAGLERRKQQMPSSVIVLEALSRIFPDDTYVTELRIVGGKMQVVGITRDAPALIRLIAQSAYFTQASFFAPTTRSPSQPGENFHIEAQILPVFTPPS